MTSYLTSSKKPLTDKDKTFNKSLSKGTNNTASQLLKEYANRNCSQCWLNLCWKTWQIRFCFVVDIDRGGVCIYSKYSSNIP